MDEFQTLNTSDFDGDIWMTADLHLGHARILEMTERPWTNIDKHDNALIQGANEVVKPRDLFIINGDLAWGGPDNHNKQWESVDFAVDSISEKFGMDIINKASLTEYNQGRREYDR